MGRNKLVNSTSSNEEIAAELEKAGYTLGEFVQSLVSVSSYAIANALYTLRRAVFQMKNVLRADKDCTRFGYKMELNAVVSAMNANTAFFHSRMPLDMNDRAYIVQRETSEYIDEHLQRMYYAAHQFLGYHKFKKPELMAHVFVAIVLSAECESIIEDRVEAINARVGKWDMVRSLAPTQVSARLRMLADKLEQLYPGADECDINDCEGLTIGAAAIANVCFDLDLMELHAAYAIEHTEGRKYLQEITPESFKLLHPNYGNNSKAI